MTTSHSHRHVSGEELPAERAPCRARPLLQCWARPWGDPLWSQRGHLGVLVPGVRAWPPHPQRRRHSIRRTGQTPVSVIVQCGFFPKRSVLLKREHWAKWIFGLTKQRRSKELQADQPHLSLWEADGANLPVNYFQGSKKGASSSGPVFSLVFLLLLIHLQKPLLLHFTVLARFDSRNHQMLLHILPLCDSLTPCSKEAAAK